MRGAGKGRRLVSLGGWCGPGLMLSKLGLRAPEDQYPFDVVRATLDGVVHFTGNGFGPEFFPPGPLPYKMDPASIWLLFRGPHTCFTHMDLNRKQVLDEFQWRFNNWSELMSGKRGPVVFLRTSLCENPFMEAGLLPMWEEAVTAKSKGALDFKTVLIVHNQGSETVQVAAPTANSSVWNLALYTTVLPTASLFDRTEVGYRTIISAVSDEQCWAPDRSLSAAPTECLNTSLELATVEGVPAMGGTCKGIGSTASVAVGRCVFCGSSDQHAVVDPTTFDTHKSWSEEDRAMLLATFAGTSDIVATCEAIALQQGRSAHEVLTEFRKLTSG
ncbi:Hypothetical protein, putative [Bodo saltans]|uniref:Uncharacterized protein n=1 Tax=Bodo saltans TaxID=75058 RepID=A0A0S4JE30_BODSA|nr:Hypothetical protein, putative [Bodo saltans]|eukprot:CUG87246.1 Hypothetical protein, putative [Bodo saltans]